MKLYYENQYLKEFKAKVIEVVKKEGRYHVVLDKTAFFPGGGGQCSDTGVINNSIVLNVYEMDGRIYHVIMDNFNINDVVNCKIDWKRREDGMHQHLGQHILSGCFFKLFDANTVSIHLGSEISTVDIVGILDEEKIRKVEELANEVISKGMEVSFLVPKKEEVVNYNLRRDLPNTEEEIRIVKIGDLDINACCGVHPSKTSDLRMIKIKKFEKNKGNTRIEFLAGDRAIRDSLNKDKVLRDICKYLSSNDDEALNGIKNLKLSLEEVKLQKKKLEEELMEYEISKLIQSGSIIKKIFTNKSVDYITKLANKLSENNNIICLFAVKNNNKANIILAISKDINKINMGELFKKNASIINGKGGGSMYLAQGIGEVENIERFLDCINNKIVEILSDR